MVFSENYSVISKLFFPNSLYFLQQEIIFKNSNQAYPFFPSLIILLQLFYTPTSLHSGTISRTFETYCSVIQGSLVLES